MQRMAAIHNRPQATARIGTEITAPDIDFAKVAQGMGVWAEGPVTDPAKLGAAIKRAHGRRQGRQAGAGRRRVSGTLSTTTDVERLGQPVRNDIRNDIFAIVVEVIAVRHDLDLARAAGFSEILRRDSDRAAPCRHV